MPKDLRDENRLSTLQARFDTGVAMGKLPTGVQTTLKGIFETLDRPVNVSVLGLPGSGKSQVLNLLAGREVIPDNQSLPTTQVIYGDTARAVCTFLDGSEETFDHTNVATISALRPVFVTLELPLPALKKISLLEVGAADDDDDQTRALAWAAKRTDLALYCTKTYDAREARIWAYAPEKMQNNTLMIVTHADVLSEQGSLQSTASAIREAAAEHVTKVLPLATRDALAARSPDGAVNKDKMRASGGISVISSVLKQVDLGLRYAVDQAEFLLAKHGVDDGSVEVAPTNVVETPVSPAKPAQAPNVQATPVYENETGAERTPTAVLMRLAQLRQAVDTPPAEAAAEPFEQLASAPEPELESAPQPAPVVEEATLEEPVQEAAPDAALEAHEADVEPEPVFEEALVDPYLVAHDYMIAQGALMQADLAREGKAAPKAILDRAQENVQWLVDHLEDALPDTDDVKSILMDNLMDATDMVQLMASEKNSLSAASDVIALMTQLKHDMACHIAA